MRTQEDDIAIKKTLVHLSRTCMKNGLGKEVFKAFEYAKPELASKHLEIVGGSVDAAVTALCLVDTDDDNEVTTGLTNYLFGNATLELQSLAKLIELITNVQAKLHSSTQLRKQNKGLKLKSKPYRNKTH